jgi:SAM-dependent methyltransferase
MIAKSISLPTHSKPIAEKSENVIANGYDESAFAENYWLTPDVGGGRRIDRCAGALLRYVGRLIEIDALQKSPRILDISAGPGMMVHQFRNAGFECEGCEFSQSGIRIAKKEFGIDLLHGDLRSRLPYEDGTFDFAMCVGVLTMIPVNYVSNALSEIRRVLADGGIVHLHLMNPNPVSHEPHLTSLPMTEWWRLADQAGLVDKTSLWPPQREGIGVGAEFSGIWGRK